jgi:hypothetical protein
MSFLRYITEMVDAMGVEGTRSFMEKELNAIITKNFFGAAFTSTFTPAAAEALSTQLLMPQGEAGGAPASAAGAEPEAQEEDGSSSGDSKESTKKKNRKFSRISEIFSEGTKFYIQSLGDRWDVELVKDVESHELVFAMGDKIFSSPAALCKAHAERITENHPTVTAPGGWNYIKVAEGPYKGKSLKTLYDANIV